MTSSRIIAFSSIVATVLAAGVLVPSVASARVPPGPHKVPVGSTRYIVPACIGLSEADARVKLSIAGYLLVHVQVQKETPYPTVVVYQDPPAGTMAPSSQVITLVLGEA